MNKTLKVVIWIIVIALAAWLVFSDDKQDSVPTETQEPIKIGALLSLTGGASAWGENAKRGIELAVAETNAKGGINGRQISVVYEDTASDPKQSVSAFRLATDIEHVTANIGPLNQTEVASVIPLIEQTKIPTIVPGFLPLKDRINLNNPVFIWTDAESEAGRLAQYVYDQGIRNVGVIGTLDAWENTVTSAFVDEFKNIGGIITHLEIVQPDTSDMKSAATKVINTKPEAIYLGTYYQFVNSTKEIYNLGFKGKLFGIEVDDYLAGETASWSEGLHFIAPDYYSEKFINKFSEKYGMAPGMPAGQSYDAANILFSILENNQSREEILAAMESFKEYDGASGQLTVSPDGRTHLPVAIFQINGGKVSKVETLE